jgi:hypothetical protein
MPTESDLPPVEIGVNKVCVECDATFVFTNGEDYYYKKRGLDAPKRCKKCRELRKREGGSFGSKVVIVDSDADHLLCNRCRKPASRAASDAKGEPTCVGCSQFPGLVDPADDLISYDQWRNRKGKNPYAG